MELKLVSNYLNSSDIEKLVDIENVTVESNSTIRLRALDPAIVVALVTATSASLGILLSGIVDLINERDNGTVVVQSKSGTRIEVPGDYPLEKLDLIIAKVQEMDVEEIRILQS